MKLIAHRGLQSKNTKENTLEAIKLGAKNKRIDGVEIDVRLTKDNKVVVIHDSTIDRVTSGSGKVREMSLERLKKFNYGSFIKRSTISTLEEVLEKFSTNTLLIIELKDELDKNKVLASKVLEIISKYPSLNIWLKSFSKEIIEYLKKYSIRPVGVLIDKSNIELLNLDAEFYSISKNVITSKIFKDKLNNDKIIMIWNIKNKEEIKYLKQELNSNLDNIYIISDVPLNFV